MAEAITATATYSDYMARHPGSTAPQGTVEALLSDVAAEIAARCVDWGTTYDQLVQSRPALVKRVECTAVYRMCGRATIGEFDQNGLSSFSQSVGDHRWEFSYSSGNGKDTLLESEWELLGLTGQRVGWLAFP